MQALITLLATAFTGIVAYGAFVAITPLSGHNVPYAALSAVLAGVALAHFVQVKSEHVATPKGALLFVRNVLLVLGALAVVDAAMYLYVLGLTPLPQGSVVDALIAAPVLGNWVLFTSVVGWLMSCVAIGCLAWSLLAKLLTNAQA